MTKEQGYKDFVLENFTRTIISLDGYGVFYILLIHVCMDNFNWIFTIFRENLNNGKNDSDSDEIEDCSESEGIV